jgi:hypothetical protein
MKTDASAIPSGSVIDLEGAMHLDGGGRWPALSDTADSRSPIGKSRLCLSAIPPGCVVLGFSAHAVHPSRPGRVTPQLPGGDLAGPEPRVLANAMRAHRPPGPFG